MEINHKLCLYVSYYLARFNNEALEHLGYHSWNTAFSDIGEKLQVKRHSVKNWRDEFDPLFGYRAGWYQRPMTPSRAKVADALEDLNELQIRSIVKDILSGEIKKVSDEEEALLSIITEEKKSKKIILRTPTGKAAEEFFIKYYKEKSKPVKGTLEDCRDLGCGYDFKIKSENSETYIEVKGMIDSLGGILFTDKEWRIATEKGNAFFLCIIKNIGTIPEINFVQNPASKIIPTKNIYTAIQVNWAITKNQLKNINV